jgi:CBS domain-containing protein
MAQIAEVLAGKNKKVFTMDGHASVFEAIETMVANNVGSILVTNDGALCGIFTERDYLRRIALEGRTSRQTRLQEVMVSRLICVDPSRSVEDCLSIMTQERIRHLPVMEEGKLAGIVSIGDLVKFICAAREMEIRYLNDYITGKYPA